MQILTCEDTLGDNIYTNTNPYTKTSHLYKMIRQTQAYTDTKTCDNTETNSQALIHIHRHPHRFTYIHRNKQRNIYASHR